MRLAYLANIRLPTEKAHGLQIMQMCEAFAAQPDCTVTLYVARRVNTPELVKVTDVCTYYNVAHTFAVIYVPCVDLFRVLPPRLAFLIQTATYMLVLALMCLNPFRKYHADLYYSRDPLTLLFFSFWTRRARLYYEAHQLSRQRWQRLTVRRVGTIAAVTGSLAARLRELGARQVLVAHDGFRTARFANPPTQESARRTYHLPDPAFIVGYTGRLHMMGMPKGVQIVVDAIASLRAQPSATPIPVIFVLAGGPAEGAAALRDRWVGHGLPAEHFQYLGSLRADQIPVVLAACDVCTIPLPWTEHFAYYVSALKLFEYMAAGRAIVASNLPGIAEVVQDGRSALLFPPDDAAALAEALARLRDDTGLRTQIAAQAQIDVQAYSWEQRAANILNAIRGQ